MEGSWRWMLLIVILPVLVLTSCNPQGETLKLFARQGLNILEPARDYIKLGGIFVLPSNGRPAYLDPYDSISGAEGSPSSIREIIEQQAGNNSANAEAVLGTLGNLVLIPAGIQFSHGTQFQLDQIDASGTRYSSQAMEALIRKPSTNAALHKWLKGGTRVFVVQEVVAAKSLSVKSSSNTGLAGSIEGSTAIPNCASSAPAPSATSALSGASGNGSSPTGMTASSSKNAGTSAGGQPTAVPPTPGNVVGSGGGQKNSTSGAGTASGTQKPTNTGSSNSGISVGVCLANQFTLSFQTDNPIPFAVRLNEVVVGQGDVLSIKVTGFQPPITALMVGADEGASVLINHRRPILRDVMYQPHQ